MTSCVMYGEDAPMYVGVTLESAVNSPKHGQTDDSILQMHGQGDVAMTE